MKKSVQMKKKIVSAYTCNESLCMRFALLKNDPFSEAFPPKEL